MDYLAWKEDAIMRIIANVEVGDEFELKGLFDKNTWDILTTSEKQSFGRFFSGEVKENRVDCATLIGRGKAHQNIYRRVI